MLLGVFSFSEVDGGRVARAKQQIRVLIAEDETIIRLDLRAQLEDLGYSR